MIINSKRICEKIMYFAWILWLFFVIAYSDSVTRYANICALIMMAIAMLYLLHTHSLYFPKQLMWITLFGIFATISILWSYDPSVTGVRVKTTWRMILLLILMTNFVRENGHGKFLFKGIELAGNLTAVYTIMHYGVSGLKQLVGSASMRVGGDFVNENTLGTFLIVSFVITLYQVIHYRNYKRIVLMVLPLIVSLLTASRKVVLIAVVSIVFIVWREMSNNNNLRGKLKIILLSIILMIILWYVYQSPIGAALRIRIETMMGQSATMDQSMINRVNMVSIGINQFKKTPFLGIGIGASSVLTGGTYLHNNYIELLATGGIVGFVLYYGFYFSCLIKLIKNKYLGEMIDISLMLLIVCVLTDFASVSYFSKTQYMSFIVILSSLSLLTTQNKGE